jgi:5'/3'-nucleotidase
VKIIITNDDGYGEPGLAALYNVVAPLGDITVVAPKTPQSYCGHRVTMRTPIRVEHPKPHHYVVKGSPADCTRLAIKEFAPDADWLIAGINPGANLGSDVYQSGTVAAAREAAIMGVKAIAVSQYIAAGWTLDWKATECHTADILSVIMKNPLLAGQFWNINLPSPITAISQSSYTICPLDKHPHTYRYSEQGGQYQYEGIIHNRPRSTGGDVDVCFNGAISATLLEI